MKNKVDDSYRYFKFQTRDGVKLCNTPVDKFELQETEIPGIEDQNVTEKVECNSNQLKR